MEEGRQNRMDRQFFQAASDGDLQFFEKLKDPNSSLLQVTIEKNTVLHVALQFKKFEAAEKIVNLSPSLVYETNSKGNTPLHVAAMVGASSLVKILIQKAKDERDVEASGQHLLGIVNEDGDTALHVAVLYDNDNEFEIVKELIKEDQELAKHKNNAGDSALFLAVDRQHYNMALHILSNAPDCSYAGRHGMNVLHALVIHTSSYSNKDDSLFQRLGDIERHEKNIIRILRVIITFAWVINMLYLKSLLAFSDDASVKKNRMRLWTSGNIPTDLVKEVVKKWPSTIEQGDNSGWTPLHIAAQLGSEELVKLLLEKVNSSAYVRNKEGLSAFHIAAKEHHYGVMKILMAQCPDIYELLDNNGRNALHAAAESRSLTEFSFFEKRPEFEGLVNQQDEEGNTPLNLAAINGEFNKALQWSKCRAVDLNATNKQGFTTMDNVLLISELSINSKEGELWRMGARTSLRGTLLKMGIQKLDPRKKLKLAGDGKGNGNGDGDGDGHGNGDGKGNGKGKGKGNGKGRSLSDFINQVRKGNMLVATLIATVTFTATFTVPGGYNQSGNVGEGLAVLSKKTAFSVFLIANTLAFGLSTTSVFVHFLASATIDEKITLHKKMERRTVFYTNWSIGAMLVAFIAGTYTVVPHSLGVTVAVLLSCCFLSSMFLPLSMKTKDFME